MKQVAEMRTFDRLLALLVGRQTGLNQLFCGLSPPQQAAHQLAVSAGATRNPLADNDTCPLCDGNGELDLSGNLVRIKLAAATAAAALAVGGGPLGCKPETGNVNLDSIMLQQSVDQWGPLAVGETNARQSKQGRTAPDPNRLVGANCHHKPPTVSPNDKTADMLAADDNDRRSLRQLLADLRVERCRLEAQIDKLGRLTLAAPGLDDATNSLTGQVLVDHQSVGLSPSSTPATDQGTVTGLRTIGGRSLSSNIQRMRRMDTLKRRKLKRDQQMKQQKQQIELERSDSGSIRFAKPFAEIIRAPQAAGNVSSLGVGALVEDEEVDEEHDGNLGAGEATSRAGATNEQLGGVKKVLASNGDDRPATSVAPPGVRQRPEQAAKLEEQPRQPVYNYQTFRASLANLMSEATGQQGGARRKGRFSLSTFGSSVSAALASPFGTPKKTKRSCQEQTQQACRKPSSSRSQSSSSGGNLTSISTRASPKSIDRPANNCSCLKSSGSSQSVGSDLR